MDMIKDVKSIEIIRENCDVISVGAADIERIYFNEIKADAFTDATGKWVKAQWAETIYIKLKPSANKDHYELECIDLERAIFDLLNEFSDIAGIEIHFSDNTSEYIQTQWSAENTEINLYQHSYIDEDRNLYIGIGEYANLKEFFNLYYQD